MSQNNMHKSNKSIHVTGCGGPNVCETFMLPRFVDNRLAGGGGVVSLTRRPPFTPEKILVLISVGG
jgi:hypothetical protein